jgi:outer membrane receptor protein involved in Fe transport
MAKLTWQVAPSWRASASLSGSDVTFENENASRFITADAAVSQDSLWSLLTLELDAILTGNLLWTVRGGTLGTEDDGGPASGDLTTISHVNRITGIRSANYGQVFRDDVPRTELTTNLSWFVGRHELKAGGELSRLEREQTSCFTGRPDGGRCAPETVGFQFIDTVVDGEAFPLQMTEQLTPGTIDSSGRLASIYLQDSWRPHPSVTITGGLRWDRAAYDNDAGNRIADLHLWQPRLGVAWDLAGDARTVVRASIGRFMDPKTMALPPSTGRS